LLCFNCRARQLLLGFNRCPRSPLRVCCRAGAGRLAVTHALGWPQPRLVRPCSRKATVAESLRALSSLSRAGRVVVEAPPLPPLFPVPRTDAPCHAAPSRPLPLFLHRAAPSSLHRPCRNAERVPFVLTSWLRTPGQWDWTLLCSHCPASRQPRAQLGFGRSQSITSRLGGRHHRACKPSSPHQAPNPRCCAQPS
jgi:hypothetical protein